jgi:serine/threonine protein kinase
MKGGNLTGGKLIGEGSSTCVFKPNLPCKNKKIDISDKRVSKLFLKKPDDLKRELETNRVISKLPRSKEWSVVLDDMCEAPDYEKIRSVEPDIDKCLKNNEMSSLPKESLIFFGDYGGVSMDAAFMTHMIDSKTVEDICSSYKSFFKKCSTLFLGLDTMYKHKMMHYDIKSGNITYIDDKYKYIDFGISTTFNDKEKIKKRALQEFNTNRIYIYYPFDILYLYANKPKLYLEKYTNRKSYDNLKDIQEVVFDRNYDSEWSNVLDLAIEGKLNTKTTIERLDTYSLGITLTELLYYFLLKTFDHLNDYDLYLMIKDVFDCKKFNSILKLLKEMTEPLSSDRIKPDMAYERFKSIF